MAAMAGWNCGPIFQSHRVVTQWFPLSPNIFNVVVDAVIRNWVTIVGDPQEGTGQGLGESIQTLAALFYADDGIVASPESARLQGAFDVLMGLFDQVVLRNNKEKTDIMACRTCHPPPRVVNGGLHSASDSTGTLL